MAMQAGSTLLPLHPESEASQKFLVATHITELFFFILVLRRKLSFVNFVPYSDLCRLTLFTDAILDPTFGRSFIKQDLFYNFVLINSISFLQFTLQTTSFLRWLYSVTLWYAMVVLLL